MPLNIPLRQKLNAGEQAAGVWLTLPSTAIAGTMARTENVSWVLIDAEHGLINDTHLYDLSNTVAANGASPIIRVPAEEPWLIKRALDAGAHGLMIPMANSAEIVRGVVRATKYPPVGITSAAGALGAEYAAAANTELVISVQIEHPQAVEEIEQICQEGIDVVFIGPFDLALSMGVEFGSEKHEAAMAKILATAQKHGKVAAMFFLMVLGQVLTANKQPSDLLRASRMVSVTTDIDTLTNSFAAELTAATGKNITAVKGYSTSTN
ncbi:Phosphoenolpyruvate/pyruvate domain-containing protein [Gymnopus androsaceus JB14]|uniref:Phosphoenolpyruvate/pyruvate domain-containing protein n=1 Tax=Gymnopus androsaceus JB14 TaxID=1447944 RepID=A0A6A4I2U2_9AGAR|nr:Phosphoenolpyruvate/pyruvate domain-containing protein [Gymnopus androsaceus JB14]